MLVYFEESNESTYFSVYDTDDCRLEQCVPAEAILSLYKSSPKLFPQLKGGCNSVEDVYTASFDSVFDAPKGVVSCQNGVYTANTKMFGLKFNSYKIAVSLNGHKVVITLSDDDCIMVNGKKTEMEIEYSNLDICTFGLDENGNLSLYLSSMVDISIARNGKVVLDDGYEHLIL